MLDVGFSLTALHPALAQHPAPFILITSQPFKQALLQASCRISRDGRGRVTDNIFIECL